MDGCADAIIHNIVRSATMEAEREVGMRMKGHTKVAGVAMALPVTIVSLGVAVEAASEPHSSAAAAPFSVDETIIIDSQIGETFTPAVTGDAALTGILSPADAYRVYSGHAGEIPGGLAVQAGYLTLPLGAGAPGRFTAKDQFVYAYTESQCGPVVLPVPAPGSDLPAEDRSAERATDAACVRWLFVDAATGEMIDMTWTNS